jgi:VWFA-related protein
MSRSLAVGRFVVVLACVALAAAAQERGGFGESVEVELVSVDVLVTDGEGRPVTDLSRQDFRLFDEGRPVEIRHFSRPPGAAAAIAAEGDTGEDGESARSASTTGAAEPDLLILFLDQLHLTPSSRERALRQVASVLDARLDRRSEVLVATFDGSVGVPLAPTRDRKALWEVLSSELVYGARALQIRREQSQILRDIRVALEIHVEDLLRTVPSDQVMDLACSATNPFARAHAEEERTRVETTAEALREFLASLAAYPGRKTLLHVSDGLPLIAGLEPLEYLISVCGGAAQMQGLESDSVLSCCPPARFFPSAAQLEMQAFSTAQIWRDVVVEANLQRVTLYTLQALGLTAPSASEVDGVRTVGTAEFAGRINRQDPLVVMAEETGGRAMLNTNDFTGDVERLLDDRTLRYELGFYPQNPAGREIHSLRLEVVDRRGLQLRYRRSYLPRSGGQRSVAGVLAALYHGREENPLGLRLRAERPEGGD